MNLSGRVAVVTGASQGIGRACALKLAARGATVALVARNQQKLDEVADAIGGTSVRAFPADVENEDQIKTTFKQIISAVGKIDILVNNAGITRDQLLMRMKRADWDAVLNTNLTSAYLCSQQAISSMLRQRWGRIINITSIFGQMGQAGQANYAASKAGIIGFTKSLARELGSRGVRANVVAPGYVQTRLTDVLPDEAKDLMLKNTPLGRFGEPADVARAVRFLCSDDASFITGEVLLVDGGLGM